MDGQLLRARIDNHVHFFQRNHAEQNLIRSGKNQRMATGEPVFNTNVHRAGGLYQAGGTAVLKDSTFSGNDARNNFGQAIVKSRGATLTINKTGAEPITRGDILNMYLDEEDLR